MRKVINIHNAYGVQHGVCDGERVRRDTEGNWRFEEGGGLLKDAVDETFAEARERRSDGKYYSVLTVAALRNGCISEDEAQLHHAEARRQMDPYKYARQLC